jgi:hypothetical protein
MMIFARRLLPVVWVLWFLALIVVNAGAGSVLFLPIGLLIIPYFLLSRRVPSITWHQQLLKRPGLALTVLLMLASVTWMTLLTFGIGAPRAH